MNKNGKHGAKYGTKEKETKKFFGRISFRAFALSLVALIQIALLLVGATYSWVETISSIKFDGATGNIGTGVNKIVKLTDTDGEVSLDNYFEQVGGDTHLAACSSADAKNFYFPIVGVVDKDNNRYRHGTINDKNVNYIDFDFQIKNTTTTEKSFRFDGVPDVPENVRIAIWAEGDSPKILAKVDEAIEKPVVSSTSGSGTTESTVQPLKNYTAENYNPDNETNDSTIFKIGSGKTVTVYIKLWLQDINLTTESTGDVEIKNFKLASYTSQKKISVALGTDVKGGSVNINGTGDRSSIIANYGSSVTLNAVASDGYVFRGWYDNAECSGTPVSTNATYSITVGDDTSAKYYAKFEVQPTRTIYYYNSNTNWKNIHFHAWEDQGASWEYPGEKAIHVRGNYWSYDVPKSYNRIIFNNNNDTDKTGTITVPTDNNLCYDSRVGAWTAIPKEGTHRIIVSNGTNDPNWNDNVYCYAWGSDSVMPNDTGKIGKKMTKITGVQHEKNDIYYIDIDNKYTNVLFTNGSFGENNQTVNKDDIGTDDITCKIDSDLEGQKYKLSDW